MHVSGSFAVGDQLWRTLDGFRFQCRVREVEASGQSFCIEYLDDGNIEAGVEADELDDGQSEADKAAEDESEAGKDVEPLESTAEGASACEYDKAGSHACEELVISETADALPICTQPQKADPDTLHAVCPEKLPSETAADVYVPSAVRASHERPVVNLPEPCPDCIVPLVRTPESTMTLIIKFSELLPGETLLDLGCGDGIACLVAAASGAHGWGVNVNRVELETARKLAEAAGVSDHCRFERHDFRHLTTEHDIIAGADVIYCFLLPSALALLTPLLEGMLAKGKRIVTFYYPLTWLKESRSDLFGMLKLYTVDSLPT